MIAYNITCKVRWDILEAWLAWQLEEQIPAMLATGLFDNHRLYRLLEQDEAEGPTFIIQLFTTSEERYRQFMTRFADDLQRAGRRSAKELSRSHAADPHDHMLARAAAQSPLRAAATCASAGPASRKVVQSSMPTAPSAR